MNLFTKKEKFKFENVYIKSIFRLSKLATLTKVDIIKFVLGFTFNLLEQLN